MKINTSFVDKVLTRFIQTELSRFGYENGILGLSGGIDSTVSAFLSARALGPDHVIGLIMPYGDAFHRDTDDARTVAAILGIGTQLIDISPSVDAYYSRFATDNRVLKGNKMARERMSILYDFSEREKALIIGTSNKTELLLGYGTLHGDMACAINPLGDLYKTQVRALGRYLEVPDQILDKAPTAGLWDGQTDEQELGLPYHEIDEILYHMIDKRIPRQELLSRGFEEAKVDRLIRMIRGSEFKRCMPPIAKISERSVGHDFLYPYDRDK
jgi:NAD+ synthase